MSRRTLGIAVVACVGLAWAGADASLAVRYDLDRLAWEADRVVVAELVSAGSAWDASGRRIYTTYEFLVGEDVAGEGDRRFTVVQPGGRVGRLAQVTHGYPELIPGESVLLFLRRDPAGAPTFRVVGLSQGVFALEPGAEGPVLRQRLQGLSFPDQAAEPLVIPWQQALPRIRAAFQTRGARP